MHFTIAFFPSALLITGLHRVLIIHQTSVRTCSVPGVVPGKAIIVVIVFERTRTYLSYFLCRSLKQRVPRFVARAACASADASQTGCRSSHTPIPAGPAEGPAGPGAVSASVGPEGGRPGPRCLVFSCCVGPAPFPLCLRYHQGEGDPVREPRRSGVRPAHHAGVERGPRAVQPPPSLPLLHFPLSSRCMGWAGPGFCWNRGAVGWNM